MAYWRKIIGLVFAIGVLLLTACGPDSFLDRREIYTDDGVTAKIRLDVDWLSSFGSKPSGMTVMAFPGKGKRTESHTNSVDSETLSLTKGTWRILLFNLTPDEFGSLAFTGLDDYDSLRVNLTKMPRQSSRAWDDGASYRCEPEAVGIATDTVEVTKRMVDESYELRANGGDTVYVVKETARPVTTTLNIRVKVKGLANAIGLQGSISGMADGYMLMQHHAVTSGNAHFLDDWKFALADGSKSDGYATTTIKTFGLPFKDGEVLSLRDSTANVLTLYFELRDGKTTRTFKLNAGHLFHYVRGSGSDRAYTSERTQVLDLVVDGDNIPQLPDVENNRSASGFDAHVDPWDDGGNTDVHF